jgi:hypothetical protein
LLLRDVKWSSVKNVFEHRSTEGVVGMLAYRVAMLVRPSDRFAGEHATWSEIWRRLASGSRGSNGNAGERNGSSPLAGL